MPITTPLSVATPAEALCKAALWNAISLCQSNLSGRTYTTAADVRVYEGIWALLVRNFVQDAAAHPSQHDSIPQTQAQQEASPLLADLEERMLEELGKAVSADAAALS